MSLKHKVTKSLGRVRIKPHKIQFWHSALKRGVVVRSQKSLPCPLGAKKLFTTQTKKDSSAKTAELPFFKTLGFTQT